MRRWRRGARLSRRVTLLYALTTALLYLALAGSTHDAPLYESQRSPAGWHGAHDASEAVDAVRVQPGGRLVRVVAPAASPPVTSGASASSSPPQNRLVGGHGLDTTVTTYSDCGGTTPLTHHAAAIDTCFTGQRRYLFFVGHNPGVFAPLIATNPGDVISYYDGQGVLHAVRIVAAEYMAYSELVRHDLAFGAYDAVFQTCADGTDTVDRVLFGDWI